MSLSRESQEAATPVKPYVLKNIVPGSLVEASFPGIGISRGKVVAIQERGDKTLAICMNGGEGYRIPIGKCKLIGVEIAKGRYCDNYGEPVKNSPVAGAPISSRKRSFSVESLERGIGAR